MFRDVSIHAVANGFVVQVGCQTFVYESPDVLLAHLREYLDNPDEKEKQMLVTARNIKHTLQGAGTPATPTPNRVSESLASALNRTGRPNYGGEAHADCYSTTPQDNSGRG